MNKNLTEQLFIVCIIIISIMVIALGIVLPNMLIPVYETNVFNYLRQPLTFVQNEEDIVDKNINSEIAYIYISNNNTISTSTNLNEVINIDAYLGLLYLMCIIHHYTLYQQNDYNYHYLSYLFYL